MGAGGRAHGAGGGPQNGSGPRTDRGNRLPREKIFRVPRYLPDSRILTGEDVLAPGRGAYAGGGTARGGREAQRGHIQQKTTRKDDPPGRAAGRKIDRRFAILLPISGQRPSPARLLNR